MKVTMEGEKVIDELWDVIAAKGFEAEPFFEIAAVEIRSLPKLEGTAHVNMADREVHEELPVRAGGIPADPATH
jgi:hypothetical protein